ncbi:MAG: hypothetical protein GXP02_09155 [Alphaproteobacteria bacterium]|nr:hypothetical protein [Alphaproteobacteria bacterium]
MVGRKLLKRIALAVGVIYAAFIGAGFSLAADLSAEATTHRFMLYSGIFFFLAFCLILWMLRERVRLKKLLAQAEKENNLQYLQLKSRSSISVTGDGHGRFSSPLMRSAGGLKLTMIKRGWRACTTGTVLFPTTSSMI